MDNKLKKYEKAILDILSEYAKITYANITGGNQLITDKEHHRCKFATSDMKKYIHTIKIT